ncbi:hypothetical protein IO89_12455 [Epilithonimonas lactis]|uniref:Uncharacterized protein n=1 Tax=Epilithonimonas lactis TaxID=421072 RepID=A0A085BEY7_9FLAO|nr:hypothetical protein IO89_12455 [Epilithonimonas lactis]
MKEHFRLNLNNINQDWIVFKISIFTGLIFVMENQINQLTIRIINKSLMEILFQQNIPKRCIYQYKNYEQTNQIL